MFIKTEISDSPVVYSMISVSQQSDEGELILELTKAEKYFWKKCKHEDRTTADKIFIRWIRLFYGLEIVPVILVDGYSTDIGWKVINTYDPEKLVMFKLKYG